MYRYVFEDSKGNKWERVNATQARRAFLRGEAVSMCPCRLRPFGHWNPQVTVCMNDDEFQWDLQHYYGPEHLWDVLVNSCTAYGCACNETGYYLAYYLQK